MVIVPIQGQLPTYHALGNNTFAAEIHFTWKKQIRPIVQRHAMSHKKPDRINQQYSGYMPS